MWAARASNSPWGFLSSARNLMRASDHPSYQETLNLREKMETIAGTEGLAGDGKRKRKALRRRV